MSDVDLAANAVVERITALHPEFGDLIFFTVEGDDPERMKSVSRFCEQLQKHGQWPGVRFTAKPTWVTIEAATREVLDKVANDRESEILR